MADVIAPVEGQPPVVETAPESGLPSDNIPQDYSGFELNDEVKGKFKDGKLNGRFSSIDEVLNKLKEAEDFKANTIRDQQANNNTIDTETADIQAKEAAQATQVNTINEMLPAFIENGMNLTPEMEAKATEVGIDIRDLKLGALELKERITVAHNVVGGSETYNSMIAWGKENMSEAQMKAFDVGVTDSNISEYAIKGLYADFKAAGGSSTPNPRISGDSVNSLGVKPYATRRELYADKEYIDSAKGRRDTAAIKSYRARLNATPQDVVYGR